VFAPWRARMYVHYSCGAGRVARSLARSVRRAHQLSLTTVSNALSPGHRLRGLFSGAADLRHLVEHPARTQLRNGACDQTVSGRATVVAP